MFQIDEIAEGAPTEATDAFWGDKPLVIEEVIDQDEVIAHLEEEKTGTKLTFFRVIPPTSRRGHFLDANYPDPIAQPIDDVVTKSVTS